MFLANSVAQVKHLCIFFLRDYWELVGRSIHIPDFIRNAMVGKILSTEMFIFTIFRKFQNSELIFRKFQKVSDSETF